MTLSIESTTTTSTSPPSPHFPQFGRLAGGAREGVSRGVRLGCVYVFRNVGALRRCSPSPRIRRARGCRAPCNRSERDGDKDKAERERQRRQTAFCTFRVCVVCTHSHQLGACGTAGGGREKRVAAWSLRESAAAGRGERFRRRRRRRFSVVALRLRRRVSGNRRRISRRIRVVG